MRVDTSVVRKQLNQLAALRASLGKRPSHQLFTDAAIAAMSGDTHIFNQAAAGAVGAQPRQNAQLKAADHLAYRILRNYETQVWIALDQFERTEIARRQRVL